MRPGSRLVLETSRSAGAAGAGMLLLAVAEPATRLALPGALGWAVDRTLAGGGWTAVLPLVAVFAAATLAEAARESLETRAEVAGALGLRRRVLRHLFALGGDGRRRFDVGDALSRVLESTKVTASGTAALVTLLASLCTSLGGLVALFWIDLRLGALFLVGAPLMWWLTRWLVRRVESMTGEYQRLHGELAGRFVDAVRGARTIRANGTADREVERVLAPLPELDAAGRLFWEAQRKAMWQAGVLAPALQIAVLVVAGFGLLDGSITPGEFLAAQAYQSYAQGLLKQTAVLARFARARGAAERVRGVLDLQPAAGGTSGLPRGAGALELRGIRFSYGDREVLRGLDLRVPAGCSVAVVGGPGAGKSTLTEVAGGLLTPDAGRVLLDGVPLDEMRPEEVRRAFSFAFERPHLLGETVADALAYSDTPPPPARVQRALRISSADGFVRRLPDGEGTAIRDLRLSGGELQRLGLARAAARGARVVVLDDVTSSVDTATEVEISAALERALRGTTRLVVAHRMSTAARADLVAWLDDGVVRAVAPHEQLMRDPAYEAVFRPRTASRTDLAAERARDPELTLDLDLRFLSDPERTAEIRRLP